MQETELARSLTWKEMPIVEPAAEEGVSDKISAVAPQWISYKDLNVSQQDIYTEMKEIVGAAEFVYYWADQGWMPEVETEIEG